MTSVLERYYDVVVIGGGPSGVMAAVAAAREGAEVLLVEKQGYLGGELVGGLLIHGFFDRQGTQVVHGLAGELLERLAEKHNGVIKLKMNHQNISAAYTVDLECYKLELVRMLQEAGVTIMLHSVFLGVLKNDNTVRGVTLWSKSGTHVVPAGIVIDCTGDGDVAANAGCRYAVGRPRDGLTQNLTLIFTMDDVDVKKAVDVMQCGYGLGSLPSGEQYYFWWEGSIAPWAREAEKESLFPDTPNKENIRFWVNSFHPGRCNFNATYASHLLGSNVWDLTTAEIKCRELAVQLAKFLIRHVPGFEDARLVATAPKIGVRETRRVRGLYTLKYEDVLSSTIFPDTVALGGFFIDIHDPEGRGQLHAPEKGVHTESGRAYGIPYRCLVPADMENLLIAGRCISTEHEALASARVVATAMATGQAAGTAAALAIKENLSVSELPAHELCDLLVQRGVMISY